MLLASFLEFLGSIVIGMFRLFFKGVGTLLRATGRAIGEQRQHAEEIPNWRMSRAEWERGWARQNQGLNYSGTPTRRG